MILGYETTANSIAYGLIVLALEPDLRQRLSESIASVWSRAVAQGRKHLSYQDDFSELQYLYGFMVSHFKVTSPLKSLKNMTVRDLSFIPRCYPDYQVVPPESGGTH